MGIINKIRLRKLKKSLRGEGGFEVLPSLPTEDKIMNMFVKKITGDPISSLQKTKEVEYYWRCFIKEIKKSLKEDRNEQI